MSVNAKKVSLGGDMCKWRVRVAAMEVTCRTLCQAGGADAAEGTMELLIAAVRIAMRQSGKPAHAITDTLSDALGNAIICADSFDK